MQDDEHPTKLDPKSELFQGAIRNARRIIRDEILKLLTRFFYSPGFFELYRNYTGGLDYKAFQQKLLQHLEAERIKVDQGDDSWPFIFRMFNELVSEINYPEIHQVSSQQQHKDYFPQIYHMLISPAYSPPSEWKEILTHLGCLYVAWDLQYRRPNDFEDFIPFVDMFLLLSFAKLMGASYDLLANYSFKGERDLKRTNESGKTKKKKADEWKAFVVAIYEHGEPVALGTRRSEAIRMIQRQFDASKESVIKESKKEEPKWGIIPDNIKTPERDSIIDLFEAKGILERDFQKVGRYWIKKM